MIFHRIVVFEKQKLAPNILCVIEFVAQLYQLLCLQFPHW